MFSELGHRFHLKLNSIYRTDRKTNSVLGKKGEREGGKKKRHVLILIVLSSKGMTFGFPQISCLCHCLSLGCLQSRP